MADGGKVIAAAANLRRRLATFAASSGYAKSGSIPASMTFREWCADLAERGLKVDGHPFTLDDRPSLIELYDQIPCRLEDANRRTLVVMKGAQMGLTVWEMLADLYMAIKFEPLVIGMFVPDQALAADKSDRRFLRLLRTIPDAYNKLIYRRDGDEMRRIGEGNVLTRIMGESAFLFLWTSGKVSTESRPMDVVSFDEVQEMTLDQIEKTRERMSASRFRYTLMLSTANWPDSDIDFWYQQGTQHAWHTECHHCGVETDLSAHFPACVDYNTGCHVGAPVNEYVYVCPYCRGYIPDPQRGRFVAAKPLATIRSYHISQIISPTITPRELIEGWNRAVTGDMRKSFFNRKLGRPFIDRDQIPVTMEDCLAASAAGHAAGLRWETEGRDTVMGIDQMGGFNAVIIKRRMPDGRQAVVHVEAIFQADPFEKCSALMRQYGVSMCVVEQLPNVNDARRFANTHRGRVFLAGYADLRDDMLQWGDDLSKSDRRTSEEDRSRYTVTLNQYKMMQTALMRIKGGACLFPDPSGLEQEVIERGERKRIVLLRDWVFLHFTKTALVVEEDDETRKLRPKVKKIGLDPHFSYANMLCDVAWARLHGTGMIIMPDGKMPDATAGNAGNGNAQIEAARAAQKAVAKTPGLEQVAKMMTVLQETCGSCSAFENGNCVMRGLRVSAGDPGCTIYDPAPR